jgi:hypothetical protein
LLRRVRYRYTDLFFHFLLAEGTGDEVSRNPDGFPSVLLKDTSEARDTLLLLLVTSVSTDFAVLSFGSSLITGRPDDPSVSVFLLGSICTRMRLISFCSSLSTGSTARKFVIVRYINFSAGADGSVIGRTLPLDIRECSASLCKLPWKRT